MQKTKLFLLLFFVSIIGLSAQEITGNVTSESGEGVPFTNIFLRERNIGIVSDINGHYRLPLDILENVGDTLIFSSIGFDTQRFSVAEFAEKVAAGNTDIVLIANYILLPEVTVTARQPRDYGFFHLRTNITCIGATPSLKLMVFVENTDSVVKMIQTVNVRVSMNRHDDVEKLRVFFYQKTEDGFQNINVADEDIFITDIPRGRIRHDVSEFNIPFPAEGIYVGVEMIGKENIVQNRSRTLGFSISSTTRARQSRTYVLDENENWVNVQDTDVVPRAFRRPNLNAQIGVTAR